MRSSPSATCRRGRHFLSSPGARVTMAAALAASLVSLAALGNHFGDVRDRLGCQLPGHTHYPFCDTSLTAADRAADLVSRINVTDKPALLTARATRALPALGVPSYYYGTNCLHSSITECAGSRCPTSFPSAPNWQSTFDTDTMEKMAAIVGKELRAAFNLGIPDNTHKGADVGLQCWGPVVNLNRDPREYSSLGAQAGTFAVTTARSLCCCCRLGAQ